MPRLALSLVLFAFVPAALVACVAPAIPDDVLATDPAAPTAKGRSSASTAATEQVDGQCPSTPMMLTGTRAAGASCKSDDECAPSCCACPASAAHYLVAACVKGTCAKASAACSGTAAELCSSAGALPSTPEAGAPAPPPASDAGAPTADPCHIVGTKPSFYFDLASYTCLDPNNYPLLPVFALGGEVLSASGVGAAGLTIRIKASAKSTGKVYTGTLDPSTCDATISILETVGDTVGGQLKYNFTTHSGSVVGARITNVLGASCTGTYSVL